MAMFLYKMLDGSGEVRKGTTLLPFDDMVMAMRYLERQGGTVLSIEALGAGRRFMYGLLASPGRISRKELAEMLNNLSMMLRAGVPILSALQEIEEDMDNQALSRVVRFLRTDIEGGQTLSEALTRQSRLFSPLVLNMCRIGEETAAWMSCLKNPPSICCTSSRSAAPHDAGCCIRVFSRWWWRARRRSGFYTLCRVWCSFFRTWTCNSLC